WPGSHNRHTIGHRRHSGAQTNQNNPESSGIPSACAQRENGFAKPKSDRIAARGGFLPCRRSWVRIHQPLGSNLARELDARGGFGLLRPPWYVRVEALGRVMGVTGEDERANVRKERRGLGRCPDGQCLLLS